MVADLLALSALDVFAVVLDAIPTPIFLKDIDGHFLAVNRAYEQISGLSRQALVGRTVFDLYPHDLAERYTLADRALYASESRQVYEVPLATPSGQRRDILVTKSVFAGPKGQPAGLIGTFTDLTEERTTRRALQQANERLEQHIEHRTRDLARANALLLATLESTADGILAIDSRGKVVGYNERFLSMWGIAAAEAHDADDAVLLRAVISKVRDPESFLRRVDELYANPDEQAFDRVELQDGRLFERYSLPLQLSGEPLGRVWNFRDVTRERQLENEMRHAQKMEAVGRLAGGIAHDFNNLLTVIFANTAFAAESLESEHPAHSDLDEVYAATKRAANLTGQLLTFSRKQVTAMRDVALNPILEEMRRMLGRLLGEDVRIDIDYDPDLGFIRGDTGQVEQVIANLCVNARDAMPSGGVLSLRTKNLPASERVGGAVSPSGWVELRVSDTGFGMSDAVRERIFEPFFTTKDRGKGTGLGLSTVFGIVAQAGGSIEVQSTPGLGTTFRVAFPRVEALADVPEDEVASERAPFAGATILLVEDEPALRRAVARQLCRAGHTVIEAIDGEDALLVAARHERAFDLLLTDVVMPRMSGIALARVLVDRCLVAKVLYISGFTAEADGLPAGATLLMKPFRTDALLREVHAVLTS